MNSNCTVVKTLTKWRRGFDLVTERDVIRMLRIGNVVHRTTHVGINHDGTLDHERFPCL